MSEVMALWSPESAPRASYTIDVQVGPATGNLEGIESVSWVNVSTEAIRAIRLTWEADSARTLDARASGRLESTESNQTVLLLHDPIAPGDRADLRLAFRGPLDVLGWYPRLDWGTPPTFDRYTVNVEAPGDPLIVATGRRQDNRGAYVTDGTPCFGLLARSEAEVLHTEVGDTLIQVAHSEETEPWARHVLGAAADAIRFYTEWAGFYPSQSLWILPALDEIWGGGPVAPGIVLQFGAEKFDEAPPDYWTYLTAHEIGHQYWGEYVLTNYMPWPDTPFFRKFKERMAREGYTSDRGLLEWLPLGAGIYMDRLYAVASGASVGSPRRRMEQYVQGVRDGIDTTLEGKPYPPDIDYNNIIAHSKGFAAVSAFAHVIGQEAFGHVLKRCLAEYGGRRVDSRDLQRLCEEECKQDLGWLFDAWVRTNEVLSYEIAETKCENMDAGFETTVRVRQAGSMRMSIPVEVTFEDGTARRATTDRTADETILSFQSRAPLVGVALDPDQELALVDLASSPATE